MLNILEDTIPDQLLEVEAIYLQDVLAKPTLIHLSGERSRPLLVSVLLHGNETTGLLAVQALLRKYQQHALPRNLSIFFGNVDAAREHKRRLDHQPDYNRIWLDGPTPEHAMMQQVLSEMEQRQIFASIDIHNNTGINPHYACVNRLDPRFLQMASLFSRTVVYFTKPEGVQAAAFAALCPAVTLECGQPGQGVDHALDYLDTCLHLHEVPDAAVATHDIDLFHSIAVVRIPREYSFGIGTEDTDIGLIEDLDHLNFSELPPNTCFGWTRPGSGAQLSARDEQGNEVGDQYFVYDGGEIRTAMPVMPSMLTLDCEVIRQDCLCYLMQRI